MGVNAAAEKSETAREKELQESIAAASIYPGFRFAPTDEELISYYLKNKVEGSQDSVGLIAVVEINKFEPWDLPAKSLIQSDNEWFFFSPRGRKYPNGSQSKRATERGYWKATGKERNVKSGSKCIGTKRTLVFHIGRAPKGERTEWIIHEFNMTEKSQDSLVICRLKRNSEFQSSDSPKLSSSNQGHIPAESNGNLSLSNIGVEPSGLAERDKEVESSSKDHSGSYISHSVEQLDSGNESELGTNEFSQLASASQLDDGYEDCYADILKDDIVDLDKVLPPPAPLRPPPLQGTAHRRIKLHLVMQEDHCWTEPLVIESTNEDQVKESMRPQPPMSTSVVSFLPHQTLHNRWFYIVFGLLTMLVLFLSIRGVPCQVKGLMLLS